MDNAARSEALFNTLPSTNGWGGIYCHQIAAQLRDHQYAEARDYCVGDIDFWIIDTAADWQDPALTTLLDDSDRLRFLQELAAYRQKFPARTEQGQKSEVLVANILQKANDRKKHEKK